MCPCLARFNSVWAAAFLAFSLAAQKIFLYSSQLTHPCFYPLCISFLCLTLARSDLFLHARLLAFFCVGLGIRTKRCLRPTEGFPRVLTCKSRQMEGPMGIPKGNSLSLVCTKSHSKTLVWLRKHSESTCDPRKPLLCLWCTSDSSQISPRDSDFGLRLD